jgi:hypothetical protein
MKESCILYVRYIFRHTLDITACCRILSQYSAGYIRNTVNRLSWQGSGRISEHEKARALRLNIGMPPIRHPRRDIDVSVPECQSYSDSDPL